jgi:hypothetical protein
MKSLSVHGATVVALMLFALACMPEPREARGSADANVDLPDSCPHGSYVSEAEPCTDAADANVDLPDSCPHGSYVSEAEPCTDASECPGGFCYRNRCFQECDRPCRICPGLRVPFDMADDMGDIPVHWAYADECISVTHEWGLPANQVEVFENAIRAWTSLPCNTLCVRESSIESSHFSFDNPRRRIHLGMSEWDLPFSVLPSVIFRAFDGKISGVFIGLNAEAAELEEAEFRKQMAESVGAAFGLKMLVDSDVESVMNRESPAFEPTDADTASYCLMYGEEPYCGCR